MRNPKIVLLPFFFVVGFLSFHTTANAKDPTFELYNSATHEITVEVVDPKIHQWKVAPGDRVSLDIPKDNNIRILIQDGKGGFFKPDYRFDIMKSAHGKTKYLTWDPSRRYREKRLRPQTGYSEGILFYSDKGFNMNFNVNERDIKLSE